MKLLTIFLLTYTLYADTKQNMFNLYQNEKYSKVCNIGYNNFKYNNKDEEYISLYAFACLKADFLDRLTVPIAMLKFSKEARSNAAYFSVIVMQKKLLYHSLVDEYDISLLNLPSTDYILSKIFDLYIALGKHEPRLFYLFEDTNDKKLIYKLYLSRGDRIDKMIIEEVYDSVIVKKHIYW
ncbi:hypothetical protein JHD48_09850 [Sulfurimonas sp. SAG-AH-194-I05]|nr:hypothetical protein [Sulfurimonas sp. SAG-AH-194-I05]MDF1876039.1 hypothetical protein [Sulfurimonas sp. SAG-AH-194-I05]